MAKQFSELGISNPIVSALTELKIVEPTEIQQKVIPQLLANTIDIVGLAKTGTGKTAAFGLPILQLIQTEKLIRLKTAMLDHLYLQHNLFLEFVLKFLLIF